MRCRVILQFPGPGPWSGGPAGFGEGGMSDSESSPGVGDMAPEFELPGSDGETHRLADHRGQRAVVLAWFPKAYTPG